MKRRLTKLVLFLVLGAIVNVAVAWGCLTSYWYSERSPWSSDDPRIDLTWLSIDRIPTYAQTSHDEDDAFGVVENSYGVLSPTTPRDWFLYCVRIRCGLPMLAIDGVRFDPLDLGDSVQGITFIGDTYHFSAVPVGGSDTENWFLPLRPIWPGFAINTVFYAALLWLLTFGLFAVRRVIRRKRGHCINCGYDLRGDFSAGCPECGWQRASET
ncbi:MAG: hypothetical protein V3T84_02295 [Phycisphaerales bacterium]